MANTLMCSSLGTVPISPSLLWWHAYSGSVVIATPLMTITMLAPMIMHETGSMVFFCERRCCSCDMKGGGLNQAMLNSGMRYKKRGIDMSGYIYHERLQMLETCTFSFSYLLWSSDEAYSLSPLYAAFSHHSSLDRDALSILPSFAHGAIFNPSRRPL